MAEKTYKGQSKPKKQRATPAKRAVRLMCIILAVLMAAGGIVYLVQFLLGSFAG
ncbi:MAG: hypothetical protein IKI03_07800 [Clostridia bacterium]|nr:hypothetical protein [Clostridia bacterium]